MGRRGDPAGRAGAGVGPQTFAAHSSDPGLVAVHVEGAVLRVTSGDGEGEATVTVTDAHGLSVTLTFTVGVTYVSRSLLRDARRNVLVAAEAAPE